MNQAAFAFRRYEDTSRYCAGINLHEGFRRYGLYDTVVARDSEFYLAGFRHIKKFVDALDDASPPIVGKCLEIFWPI